MESSSSPPASVTPPWDVFPQRTLDTADIVVLVLYFVFVLAVGLWSMWKTQRSTVKGYFLAGGEMVWWPVSISASLFASNVGSGHFIGLAGSGAAGGIAATAYEWNLLCTFQTGLSPTQVTTMPEYLRKRFGGKRIQIFLAILYLFIYIFTKISVDMYAGALFIQQALHWDLYVAVIGLLAVTAVYTVAGGLAAVIYTDALQTFIMLIGAVTLMIFSFVEVGGLEGLQAKYFDAIPSSRKENSSCGLPRPDAFHIFRDPVNSDLPWPGVLVGMTIPSLWYWCTDQVIVQRSLAAKNLSHAKGGSLMTSYLKILPLFMMVMPGMISRILFPDLVACADPEICRKICGNPSGCSDIAYPKLVIELLPVGLRGLMMAVMIAALMSSLTSIFNSASTIFTMDLWKHFRPRSSEWELMIIGRVFVLLLTVMSILWIPLVQAGQGGQLFIYIQSISSYLQPPVAMVFILGCFWKRANEKGAFWGLVIGLLLGFIRLVLDFIYPEPQCGQTDIRPGVVKHMHYLYFSMVLAAISTITVLLVSTLTEPPAEEMVRHPLRFLSLPLICLQDAPCFTHGNNVEMNNQAATSAPSGCCWKGSLHLGGAFLSVPHAMLSCGSIHTRSAGAPRHMAGPRSRGRFPLGDAFTSLLTVVPGARNGGGRSRLATLALWLCGMERGQDGPEAAPVPREAPAAAPDEAPWVRHVLNINLLLCLSAGVFLWAYFA
uniref:Sodium/myo-inositol cotransporter 2 n=1 Tax=Nothoprocta perdicaria TaxID=30464 RepID=A0A8C6ZV82_NOTPE